MRSHLYEFLEVGGGHRDSTNGFIFGHRTVRINAFTAKIKIRWLVLARERYSKKIDGSLLTKHRRKCGYLLIVADAVSVCVNVAGLSSSGLPSETYSWDK